MGKDMDSFLTLLTNTTDTKQKLTIGQELLIYLQKDGSIECQDIGHVVDSLLPWIQSSNSKVSQMGIDLMTELVKRMEHYFKPYIPSVVPSVIDRLGDNKEFIRDRCQLILIQLMDVGVISPQALFDRLQPAFTHKNSNVRDEIMKCLNTTLNQHGASCISISRLVPSLVKLLSDPNATVRDNALCTLANVYRHVGDRLKADLIKKQSVPPSKMPILMAKFDEIKIAGDFFPTATAPHICRVFQMTNELSFDWGEENKWILQWDNLLKSLEPKEYLLDEDEPDRSMPPSVRRVPSSASTLKRNLSNASARSISSTPASSNAAAGAVDEEGFIKAFEAVPVALIYSVRDLEDQLNKIRAIISSTDQDWNKRVEAIKKIRSLLIAGAHNHEEFYVHLRQLDPPFQATVKDLRSQVVREACVTIAFMSQILGHRFEIFADSMLPNLINLIQNSAKVVASAGQVCIGFLVKNTTCARLIPHICTALTHKSREIRRASVKYLHQIISSWPLHSLQKHLTLLQNALSSAIADADQEVRVTARKGYWAFKEHFPDQAEILLNNLDANYKRSLHSDMSNSSSSNSLNTPMTTSKRPPPGGSMENLSGYSRRSSGSSIPVLRKGEPSVTELRRAAPSPKPVSLRSNSAVDLQAAQRAKARAQYAAMARQKIGSNASLPRPKKTTDSGPSSLVATPSGALFSPEHSRQGRRATRVSQSQPSSRSGSPSSRLNYGGYGLNDRSRRSPSIGGSRETSPGRSGSSLHHHSFLPPLSSKARGSISSRSTLPTRPPVLSQRVLQKSIEAESALADALTGEQRELSMVTSPRRIRGMDEPSDDSETSSVCSERSFESSHRRTSDSFSWSGSQSRLYREPCELGIKEIMQTFESTHWSDRKEGLVSLSIYLQDGNTLSPHQLTRITEHFTKMLSDSHTKVFGLFLDTVNDLIKTHSSDLRPWLYVLLTRLFNKLGSDLLTSIQTKINRTLDTVRDSFGSEAVLQWALKFLVDPTQTPNTRVKLSVLQFLAKTAPSADPTAAFPPPSPNQASRDITTAALTKLIGWTMGDSIKQGSELRRASQEAILALFNLNPSQVTLRLSSLPKEYQEAAASLIQGRVRKPSSDMTTRSETALSPDQVYRSLRKTTAEIQSYSYDGKVADTASHDSGISQMSLNDKQEADLVTNWNTSLSLSSPTKMQKDFNGLDMADSVSLGNGCSYNGGSGIEGDVIGKTLDTLDSLAGEDKKLAISLLATQVKEADPLVIAHHFKGVLRVILPLVDNGDVESREYALTALCEMLKKKTLGPSFQSYTELIILNIIKAYGDTMKEVARHAEPCIEEVANALRPDIVLKVLIPLMRVEAYPHNLAAIKALTKVVEANQPSQINPFLPELMPGLITAYAHEESQVRKSAVFCMVALHNKLGDDSLSPYLSTLPASKLKLLDLYINKKHSSSPNSPKSTPNSAPSTSNNGTPAAAHV